MGVMITQHGFNADRWTWLCPLVAVALAAGVFLLFGWSLWSALLGALVLVCPVLLAWGVIKLRQPPQAPRD